MWIYNLVELLEEINNYWFEFSWVSKSSLDEMTQDIRISYILSDWGKLYTEYTKCLKKTEVKHRCPGTRGD